MCITRVGLKESIYDSLRSTIKADAVNWQPAILIFALASFRTSTKESLNDSHWRGQNAGLMKWQKAQVSVELLCRASVFPLEFLVLFFVRALG